MLAEAYPQRTRRAALKTCSRPGCIRISGKAPYSRCARRALLADDMGLGKTVQAIAAVELFARHFGVERVLVICPASVKQQWQTSFSASPGVTPASSAALRRSGAPYADASVLKITNYEALESDLDTIRGWAPELLIVDEAQRIKNWNTIAARTLKRIDSPYALVLTARRWKIAGGTGFHRPVRGSASAGPTWRLLEQHQTRDESGRVIGYRDLDRIGEALAPIMLRRRKSEVLPQLPERVDKKIFVAMTPEQRAHHDEKAPWSRASCSAGARRAICLKLISAG